MPEITETNSLLANVYIWRLQYKDRLIHKNPGINLPISLKANASLTKECWNQSAHQHEGMCSPKFLTQPHHQPNAYFNLVSH